jgi:hypothetical protein
MPLNQNPPTKRNSFTPAKPPTKQSETKACIGLHNWIDGICSRCGAEKPGLQQRGASA